MSLHLNLIMYALVIPTAAMSGGAPSTNLQNPVLLNPMYAEGTPVLSAPLR